MNIEELSKSQLILLTILVNFVTSVATGILTVSLLDHAPPVVTQTVNRVVEHTIETVAQAAPAAVAPAPAPAPSNQDLVMSAISADASRAVAIYDGKIGTTTPGTTTPAITAGTFLPKSHVVATAASSKLPDKVVIGFADGSYVPAALLRTDGTLALYAFAKDAKLPKVAVPSFVSASDLKLGQTVLGLSSDGSAATGIVSRVAVDGIHTTLPTLGAGSAAVDLAGDLIGIAPSGQGALIPAQDVATLLAATSTATSTQPST